MRKIKFTQQTISERLTAMLTDFPRLSDIHPFYSDLCNTLYDRDHYKLALGQINTAKTLVDAVARDMIRMVKYGDSLYRCKCLKRAALGRMCTILKRQKASLSYLEEVRKHMSRLPALDPNTRTLLMCGLPNVGKSSFMNKITRANVDVQPYAFTTKSLFVGHTDYKYLRWQVIDTPGILDHSLEQRNTIEMQAITALAHLTCSVLYFMDISEQCGYTIEQQCNLFRSIQPLFANKQLVVVVYPTARDGITREAFIPDSVLKEREEGEKKSKKKKSRVGYAPTVDDGEEEDDTPSESEDEEMDGAATAGGTRKKTARELMWENGGPGVWAPDYREQYDLADPEWRFDAIPQILDGKNIADYVDPDIEEKLRLLEEEEEQLQAEYEAANMERMDDDDSLDEMEKAAVTEIRDRIKIARTYKERPGGRNRPILPREVRGRAKDCHDTDAKLDAKAIEKRMEKYGVDVSQMLERGRKRERDDPRVRRRNTEREADKETDDSSDEEMKDSGRGISKGAAKRAKKERDQSVKRERSQARSHSKPREPSQMGLKDEAMAKVAKKVEGLGQKRWHGGSGEGDQRKAVHLVKWMNTGKKRNGTHYCR
eukprot:scaffold1163_cov193-Alexandrium_tamarense.AAC.17